MHDSIVVFCGQNAVIFLCIPYLNSLKVGVQKKLPVVHRIFVVHIDCDLIFDDTILSFPRASDIPNNIATGFFTELNYFFWWSCNGWWCSFIDWWFGLSARLDLKLL